MISFGASLNAIPWLYSTEILPLRVRAQGTALSVFNNWIWVSIDAYTFTKSDKTDDYQVFLIVMVTPTLVQNLKWKTYLIFMAFVSGSSSRFCTLHPDLTARTSHSCR
jgi:hypothetical protein